jgi:NAD(P)-dependent dehydrogenase (short-subunit alcohol dehydrogenase family)
MPRENGFENKRVVIIGGSSGIGLAVAEEAASQGAEVVIVSSNGERVQEAIQSIGGKARGQAVDVSGEKAVEGFFTKLGAFDHLVFTAGDSLQLHPLADTDLKEARRASRGHRRLRNVLLLNMRVQSHIANFCSNGIGGSAVATGAMPVEKMRKTQPTEIAMARMNPITIPLITRALLFVIRN